MPSAVSEASQATRDYRNTVRIGSERVDNITNNELPSHHWSEDHSWDIQKFKERLDVQFHRNEKREAVFSLIGCDASLANAFRRILISGLPTLAITDVHVRNNTSVIQDEVIAHRLGLVPLQGNSEGIRWMEPRQQEDLERQIPLGPEVDNNTIVLTLQAKCEWKKDGMKLAARGETDPNLLYEKTNIYAKDLVFQPWGIQKSLFSEDKGPIRPSHPDILLVKLRPGQEIDMTCHATKSYGRDHSKYSPVATASYRLLPKIDIVKPITGEDARKFARCFPRGVIGLKDTDDGDVEAEVRDAFRDTVSRECLRHDEFKDKVRLGRVKDHFIYTIESTGQYNSDELFLDSIHSLRETCKEMKVCLAKLKESE